MDAKKARTVELHYRVFEIRTVKFVFGEFDDDVIDNLMNDNDNFNLNVSVNIDINGDKSLITIDILTELTHASELLISHTARTVFEVLNLKAIFDIQTNMYQIPDPLLISTHGLAFSPARALLATEMARTNFKNKFYLPIIDPSQFVKNKKKTT